MTPALQRLGVKYPIVQGPFGGFSTSKLVSSVSNRGGLGSFGSLGLSAEAIVKTAAEIRALTNHPFAMNLWVIDHDPGGSQADQAEFDRVYKIVEPYYNELGVPKPQRPERFHQRFEDQIEGLLEARPPVFSFVFGIPPATILAECRRRDILTLGAATSLAEAQALDEAGVDMIVATGLEAGGHRVSWLARAEDSLMGTMSLVQLVAPRVKAPVIAAGGIVDGRGIKAVQALGAHAAQIGTAFLACEESGTTPEHRAILFSDRTRDTVLTRTLSGRLARGVRNRWVDEMSKRADLPPYPMMSWFVGQLRPAAIKAGRTDLVSLWSGQSAPNLKHRTVPALMDALIAELS